MKPKCDPDAPTTGPRDLLGPLPEREEVGAMAIDGGSVPVGTVCPEHLKLVETLARVETRQDAVMASQAEMKETLAEIFALLREQNSKGARTHEEVALVSAQIKSETLARAAIHSAIISAAAYTGLTALWEWVRSRIGGMH